ncbi:MAG TPA: hypothetical protein VH062_06010 [Polyangiaceae bacterium]|jgi:hypothetical protein|nr:hypothetical protein [Polyangiaceae bacterium]
MYSLLLRLRARHLLAVLGAVGLSSGCVSGSAADGSPTLSPRDAGLGNVRFVNFDSGLKDVETVGEGGIDSRCGTADFCSKKGSSPDDPLACADYEAGAGPTVPSLEAGAARDASVRDASARSRDAGAALDAGDASSPDATAPNGVADRADASEPGAKSALPVPAPLPPLPDAGPRFACQVVRDNSGGPVHQCVPSGLGGNRSPCKSVGDCAPGLACVGTDQTGQCLPYCCQSSTVCGPDTFCAERPLLDASTTGKALAVPVCSPGEDCALLEPFPCVGDGCSCNDPANTACTVVRADGTRGCVTPGSGKVNDRCPCAAGYYCSLATSSCVKVCKTDGMDDRCAPGKCQAAAGFPVGFGLCVGYVPTAQ